MRAVTSEIMAEIDKRAQEEYGIPADLLMENAGKKVVETVVSDIPCGDIRPVIIFCGKGNNGGDGFVAARLFKKKGFGVHIFCPLPSQIKSGAAEKNFNEIKNDPDICMEQLKDFTRSVNFPEDSVVIDAVFGTGFKGDLPDDIRMIGEKVNGSGMKVYAVDIPSGLNASNGQVSEGCIRADKTVTFGLPKKGFYEDEGPVVCGEIVIADIGFPVELIREYLS